MCGTIQEIVEKKRTCYADTDVSRIETWMFGLWPKNEIWQKAVERPPLSTVLAYVATLATDDALEKTVGKTAEQNHIQRLSLEASSAIADLILELSRGFWLLLKRAPPC